MRCQNATVLFIVAVLCASCCSSRRANDAQSLLAAGVTEPEYKSQNPLYFHLVFGRKGKASMLGVLDESQGTGTGYDVAYVDENMDGDLSDEPGKRCRSSAPATTGRGVQIAFYGPLWKGRCPEYTLSSAPLEVVGPDDIKAGERRLYWRFGLRGWHYDFRDGRMKLYATAAEALRNDPIRLGSACKWDVKTIVYEGNVHVVAALRDANGCALGLARSRKKRPTPTLALARNGKTVLHEAMKFG